jgi:mannosyltransferase OCH1-like enzyme
MIPKIIHYCWLSGDPFPPEIQQCIDTWKEQLPDYEVWLWDTNRFDVNAVKWTQQAFEKRKYAFAADYIRLFALYHFGGIYLDSDVIVYKSFNDLLRLPYFIGHDQIRGFEAAIIGAEPGCKWIKDLLDSYEGLEFVRSDGSLDILPLPCRFHHVLTGLGYKFYRLHQLSDYVMTEKRLEVFDGDFFNSRNAIEVRKTKKSYCAHNYAGSWQNKKASERSIKDMLPKWLLKIIYDVGQKTWARNKYAWFQIPFENK